MHQRTRARLVAVSTALLVLLAGCLGATSGPRATPTPEESAGAPYEVPVNGTALEEALAQGLEAEGSFTYNETAVARVEGQSSRFSNNRTVRVDLDSGRVLAHVEGSFTPTTETFRSADGEAYARAGFESGSARYPQPNDRAVNATRYVNPSVGDLVDNVSLEYAGETTVDGRPRYVYEATSVDQVDAALFDDSQLSPANLTEFDFRLTVDRDGLLRTAELHFAANRSGSTQVFTTSTRYQDVGSTTVERPSWVEQARTVYDER